MLSNILVPEIHPQLRPFISSIIPLHFILPPGVELPQYPYPWSTQVRLCFYLDGDPMLIRKKDATAFEPCERSFVVGPQLTGATLQYGRSGLGATICFQPGAFYRMTGVPASEMVNREVDASLLFGKGVKELYCRLQDVKQPADMYAVIEAWFLRYTGNVRPVLPFDQALDMLTGSNGNMPVDTLAGLACLSARQLERKCKERLGMSPKLFSRLLRFSKAFALKEGNSGLNWTAIAHHVGYYDQMHLIRDFRQFAGFTPSLLDKQGANSARVLSLFET